MSLYDRHAGFGSYRGVRTKPLGTHPLRGDAAFDMSRMPAKRHASWLPVEASFEEPFVGVTTDGSAVSGLRQLRDDGFDPMPAVRAAREFLAALDADQRAATTFPADGVEWRKWSNAYPTWEPHGLFLRDLDDELRRAVLEVVHSSLSPAGFDDLIRTMRLNETLAELFGDHDNLGEWTYRFAIFGEPSATEPWGWQFHGHHLDLNMLIVGRQVCLNPVFLGAEPAVADEGKYAGTRLFDTEQARGLALFHELDSAQRDAAVLCDSMLSSDLPPHLNHVTDGRHQAGAGRDNLVLPYEGLCARGISSAQRRGLMHLAEAYVARWPEGPAVATLDEFRNYLDEAWFAWVGSGADGDPFYYRVHSPCC